jgi:hypothetical protein
MRVYGNPNSFFDEVENANTHGTGIVVWDLSVFIVAISLNMSMACPSLWASSIEECRILASQYT